MRDPVPCPPRPSRRSADGRRGRGRSAARSGVAPVKTIPAVEGESDAPVLHLACYDGPLDLLLEDARAGRVDLRQLSALALVEQCVAAVGAALRALRAATAHPVGAVDRDGTAGDAGVPDPPPLPRLVEWVGMAAWLVRLRTRLLLPEYDPEARAAQEEADALRRGLARRAAVQEAVEWLDAQLQLGRDVFACWAVETRAREAAEHAAVERAALLRAYARRIDPVATGHGRNAEVTAYRPRPPRLWRVPDALRRIERFLADEATGCENDDGTSPASPGTSVAPPAGADLWRFLPDAADLDAAGLAPEAIAQRSPGESGGSASAKPNLALLGRSAAASTFMAALELARSGRLTLAQDCAFGAVVLSVRRGGLQPHDGAAEIAGTKQRNRESATSRDVGARSDEPPTPAPESVRPLAPTGSQRSA